MFSPGEFGPELLVLDDGRLLIRKCWQGLFAEQGLASFEDFMATDKGQPLDPRAGRTRTRLELDTPQGPKVFYLKRHHQPGLCRRVAVFLGLRPSISNARQELTNVFRLQGAGLATITPAAAGEAGCAQGSFIMTEELSGYLSLHDYLAGFSPEPGEQATRQQMGRLSRALAAYTRTLHAAGMDHHDLYLCHFFVRPSDPAESLTLLDLQRLRQHTRIRRHGRIKDLAALNYSALQVRIPAADRLRFFLEYLQQPSVRQLTGAQRRLLRAIIRKARRIQRHDRKLQRRRPRMKTP